MEYIKSILKTFVYVLAGITVCTAIFISVFIKDTKFPILLLWQMIGMAAICSTGNLIYYTKAILSKRQMKIRIVCHYFFINLVVFTGAIFWDWITPGMIPQFVVMLLQTAIVYTAVMMVNFHQQVKDAESFNRRLNKFYAEREDNVNK